MLLNASKCELPKGNWLIPTALLQANTLRFFLELDVKCQLWSLMSILTEHLDGDIQKRGQVFYFGNNSKYHYSL